MFSKNQKQEFLEYFQPILNRQMFFPHAENILEETRFKNLSNFISRLQDEEIVKLYKFKAKNDKTVKLYTSQSHSEIKPYYLALAMFPSGYFCNLSSIYYHLLTNQIPKTIYVCNETISANRDQKQEILSNNKIQRAFIKPHRYTRYIFEFNNFEIVVVDRVKHSGHGIISSQTKGRLWPARSGITCIERALIDAVVSPQYNGGIVSVYTYFKHARARLDINKLIDIYKNLDFLYPYSQTIGFFFDKLGMNKQASKIYSMFPPKFDFFVDHNAKTTWKIDNKWKIYYPEGLVDENR